MPAHVIQIKSEDFKMDTMQALSALEHLIKHNRSSLATERAADKAKADKQYEQALKDETFKNVPRADMKQFYVLNAYGHHIHSYYDYLPRLLNYSCLLQIYTVFENRAALLCDELRQRDDTIPLRIEDVVGRSGDNPNVDHLHIYLEKLCKIGYRYWHDLKLMAKLRHRIIHNAGYTADTSKLIPAIIKTKGLDVYPPLPDPKQHEAAPSDPSLAPDPPLPVTIVPPDTQRYSILVKDAYIDFAFERVKGFFEHAFKEKAIPNSLMMSKFPLDVAIWEDTDAAGKSIITIKYED